MSSKIKNNINIMNYALKNWLGTQTKIHNQKKYKETISIFENINEKQPHTWTTPKPLVNNPSEKPYPLSYFPDTIKNAIEEVIEYMKCPEALAGCSALSTLSLAGQGLVDVSRDRILIGPTSLYLLALAISGERKSAVDKCFISVIEKWESEQITLNAKITNEMTSTVETWEAKHDGLLCSITAAAKSANSTDDLESKLDKHIKEKPIPLKTPILSLGDATTEAVAWSLANGWPYSGIISSEAGIIFGGHSMNKETATRNMSQLNLLWDGRALKITRRSKESFFVDNCRLTMGLAVQPQVFHDFFSSSNGLAKAIGFTARFLITEPKSTQGYRPYTPPLKKTQHLEAFHERILKLLEQLLNTQKELEHTPTVLELSPEAKNIWEFFYNETEEELKTGGSLTEISDTVSKIADNAARIAALFHLFDIGTTGSIGEDHMISAVEIVRWHLFEAKRILGSVIQSHEHLHAKKLDEWLIAYCSSNNTTQVSTRLAQRKCSYALRDKNSLDDAINILIKLGRIRRINIGKQKLLEINPALLATT